MQIKKGYRGQNSKYSQYEASHIYSLMSKPYRKKRLLTVSKLLQENVLYMAYQIYIHRKYKHIVSKRSAVRVWPFLVLTGQLYSSAKAMRNYLSLPEIVPILTDDRVRVEDFPGISIIVPARNEEANIARLLNSLVHQNYPCYEVIVVDDGSTDSTAAIVQAYAENNVRLISIDGPPEGWTGKNHACWIGAGYARFPWLLFVDADTELAPFALRSTIRFVVERDVRALSLFPQQRCETFWERLLLPFAFQQYFVGTDARVNEMDGPALANGQYFFISQHTYQQVHGHAANAGSIVDDAALALTLKRAGIISLACRGEELASVRMYTNLRQIANGFGKNIYPYMQESPLTGVQTMISTTLASAVALLFVDARREKSSWLFGMAVLSYIVQVGSALSWFKHFHITLWYALLTPLAALTFLAIAINSLLHTLLGQSLAWKGRTYATHMQGPFSEISSLMRKKWQGPTVTHGSAQKQLSIFAAVPALFVVASLLCSSVMIFYRGRRTY